MRKGPVAEQVKPSGDEPACTVFPMFTPCPGMFSFNLHSYLFSQASNSITCPVCRANCVCPAGVERLPLNLALKNMVEKLEAAQKGKALGTKFYKYVLTAGQTNLKVRWT